MATQFNANKDTTLVTSEDVQQTVTFRNDGESIQEALTRSPPPG
jgi:hypothetical protein